MTHFPSITIRYRSPKPGGPSLAYTGRIHRDFATRWGVSVNTVLEAILTNGFAENSRYIFTLAKEA